MEESFGPLCAASTMLSVREANSSRSWGTFPYSSRTAGMISGASFCNLCIISRTEESVILSKGGETDELEEVKLGVFFGRRGFGRFPPGGGGLGCGITLLCFGGEGGLGFEDGLGGSAGPDENGVVFSGEV